MEDFPKTWILTLNTENKISDPKAISTREFPSGDLRSGFFLVGAKFYKKQEIEKRKQKITKFLG